MLPTAPLQKKALYIVQIEEHPSPFPVFPSSHCSVFAKIPSPQIMVQVLSVVLRKKPVRQIVQVTVELAAVQLEQLDMAREQLRMQAPPDSEQGVRQLKQLVLLVQLLQFVTEQLKQLMPDKYIPGAQVKQLVLVVVQVRQLELQGSATVWLRPLSQQPVRGVQREVVVLSCLKSVVELQAEQAVALVHWKQSQRQISQVNPTLLTQYPSGQTSQQVDVEIIRQGFDSMHQFYSKTKQMNQNYRKLLLEVTSIELLTVRVPFQDRKPSFFMWNPDNPNSVLYWRSARELYLSAPALVAEIKPMVILPGSAVIYPKLQDRRLKLKQFTVIAAVESEDSVPAIEVELSLVTERIRLRSLAELAAVASNPVRHEKLFTVPVIFTLLRLPLEKMQGLEEERELVAYYMNQQKEKVETQLEAIIMYRIVMLWMLLMVLDHMSNFRLLGFLTQSITVKLQALLGMCAQICSIAIADLYMLSFMGVAKLMVQRRELTLEMPEGQQGAVEKTWVPKWRKSYLRRRTWWWGQPAADWRVLGPNET